MRTSQSGALTLGVLNWLFSDHLSSTTIVTDESGTMVSEMKYTAFGEIRSENGVSPTDYTYTGQRFEVEFGLSYYVARWLDSSTAHFVQADSLIPQPGNAGDWDRYAYVLWNPLRYTDPSGHVLEGPNDDMPLIDGDPNLQKKILKNQPKVRRTSSTFSPDDQYDILYNASFTLKDTEKYLIKQDVNECGVASLAMVINYMAQDNTFITIGDLAEPMMFSFVRLPFNMPIKNMGNTKGATFPWGLAVFNNLYSAYTEEIHGVAQFSYNNSIDDVINELNETHNPVTVVLNMGSSLHYVNVVGYDLDNIIVMDPEIDTKLKPYSRTDFNQYFSEPWGLRGMMISYHELWWNRP